MKAPIGRRLLHSDNGAAAVETALVLPVFFIALVFGVIKIALLLWTDASLNYAAEAAARCASVNSTQCGSGSAIQTYALNNYFGQPVGATNPFTYSASGCGHSVTASYTYTLAIPVVGSWNIPLTATACFP